jgi:hypothetical protein
LCVEVGVGWAVVQLVSSVCACEVVLAQVVDQVVSVLFSLTLWVSASRWYVSLAGTSLDVVVQSLCAGSRSSDSIQASEVSLAVVVDDKVAITSCGAFGMLTSIWHSCLAHSCLGVVVSTIGTGCGCLESVVTGEVGSADIVNWVVSVGLGLAEGVLASRWSG